MNYRFTSDYRTIVKINDDGTETTIPADPNNPRWFEYLEWRNSGNTPLPIKRDLSIDILNGKALDQRQFEDGLSVDPLQAVIDKVRDL